MLTKGYAVLSAGLVGFYLLSAYRGWELGSLSRETQQQSTARHAAGGHRSSWISGYRGGK